MGQDDVVIQALLGVGTRYEGKLFFDGRVRIDGELTGEVRSEGLLVIGEEAVVRGKISVGTLIVRGGFVDAEVHASELVELHAPAHVRGDIHTPALFVDRGVQFDGSCAMGEIHGLRDGSDLPKAEESQGPEQGGAQMDQPTSSWKVIA